MKAKLFVLCYAICLFAALSACGGADNSNVEIDTTTPKTSEELADIRDQIGEPETVTRASGMNEKELLADINNHDDFFEWFSPDAGFIATSIQINQRNTEKKESDEIYAAITSVNECSSYTAEFYLYYKYYSEGGWRLETLFQNDAGMYNITSWPQEDALYTSWDNARSNKDDIGSIDEYEIQDTGNDYIAYLVSYSRPGEVATEHLKAEVRYVFKSGLWYASPISYLNGSTWEANPKALQGLYLGTRIDKSNAGMEIYIINIYFPDKSYPQADYYEYICILDTEYYGPNFRKKQNCKVSFGQNAMGFSYGTSSAIVLKDGAWSYAGVQMERQENSNLPLSEADAISMIRQKLEENGFPYWDSDESARLYQGQEELQRLAEQYDISSYQQACENYYGQTGFNFPDTLDASMYTLYLQWISITSADAYDAYAYTENAPNAYDYME